MCVGTDSDSVCVLEITRHVSKNPLRLTEFPGGATGVPIVVTLEGTSVTEFPPDGRI
jgi:hypothetical protein